VTSDRWEDDGKATSDDVVIDRSKLSEVSRSRFDAETVWVVDSDTNASSYAFRNVAGTIPDATFFARYHETTGRTDLDDLAHRSPGTPFVAAGVLGIAGGFIGALALIAANQPEQTCQTDQVFGAQVCSTTHPNQGAAIAGELGFALLSIVGASLVVTGLHRNRAARELSRDDAERFARQYDQVLFRTALFPPEPSP
jgi:hypothetical protein